MHALAALGGSAFLPFAAARARALLLDAPPDLHHGHGAL
jgi:hypothetical protein